MAWAGRATRTATGVAGVLSTAGVVVAMASGCGSQELGGGAGGDGAGGRGGGGSDAEVATATVAAGFEVDLGRVVVEQGHKVQGENEAFYLSAHAWFTEEEAAPIEDPACEGVVEGDCTLVGPCPSVEPAGTLVDVGAASLASGQLGIGMPRLPNGTYGVAFDQRLAGTGDGVDATFGTGRDRFHVTLTVPPELHVVAPTLGDPIPRDEDLVVEVDTVGTAAEIHFAIGDENGRIECTWPGPDRGGVVPSTLLEQLEADAVLVVAWTEQTRREIAGFWDVAWVAREVAYASPVELR